MVRPEFDEARTGDGDAKHEQHSYRSGEDIEPSSILRHRSDDVRQHGQCVIGRQYRPQCNTDDKNAGNDKHRPVHIWRVYRPGWLRPSDYLIFRRVFFPCAIVGALAVYVLMVRDCRRLSG